MRSIDLLLCVSFIFVVQSSHAMLTSSKALQKCATVCMCERLWVGQQLPEIYGDVKEKNIPVFKRGCLGEEIEPEFFNRLAPKNKEWMLRNGTIRAKEPGQKNKAICMMTIAAAHGAKGHLNEAAYEAVRQEHEPFLRFLSSCAAQLTRYHTYEGSPLFLAKKGVIMRELLHLYSLNPNIEDMHGATPLHWMMRPECEYGCVEELLKKVSPESVNAVDLDGWSVLHRLALMRYEDAESFVKKMVLLRSAGCDLNALTPNGETPMSVFYRRSCSPLPVKKKVLRQMKVLGAQPCKEDSRDIERFFSKVRLDEPRGFTLGTLVCENTQDKRASL